MEVAPPAEAANVPASTIAIGDTFSYGGDICLAIDAGPIGSTNVPVGGLAGVKLSNGVTVGLNSFTEVTPITYKAVQA